MASIISSGRSYPAAGHILQPFKSPICLCVPRAHDLIPLNMLPIHITRLATDGVSGSPGSNMPTRQLVSAHSTASNHSPALPQTTHESSLQRQAPKIGWLPPQTPRIFRHSAKDAPGNAHITQFSRALQDNIHYSLQEDLQTSGIGNLSRDYSTIRSLSIFVTCGFV